MSLPIVVVGGGISGISTAYYLSKLSKIKNRSIGKIILIESSSRFGGWIETIKNKNNVHHEIGPRSLRKTPNSGENTLELISELGLTDDVLIKSGLESGVKNRYIAMHDELAKLPNSAMSLFFKQKPFTKSFVRHLFKEYRTPKLDLTKQSLEYLGEKEMKIIERNMQLLGEEQLEDISIHEFFRLRIDEEFANYIIDPMLRGISSGNARTLSIRSMFEQQFKFERICDSVIKGMLTKSRIDKSRATQEKASNLPEKLRKISGSSIWSFNEGMAQLPNAIVNELSNDSNVELRKCNKLLGFELDVDNRLNLNIENSEQKQNYQIKAEQVFFSLNAVDLVKLIPDDNEKLNLLKSTLDTIKSSTVCTINLEFKKKNLLSKYPGFGFLLPSIVNSSILGCIFDSTVFPELDGSNEITRLSVMAGGDWFNELCTAQGELDENKLMKKSMEILNKYLEINEDPSFVNIRLLRNCIPQYRVGHYLKLKLLDKQINENKLKLSLIGSSYSGISLNDCIYNSKKQVDSYLNVA